MSGLAESQSSEVKVALLGLGTMGLGMAQNLLKAGFPLTVYNRTAAKAEPLRKAGATVATTVAEAAAGADVVLAMLADDQASRAAWLGEGGGLGALGTMKPGSVIVEASTVSPAWIAELASEANRRGLRMMDAPVTGSRAQAEAGQLIFLVGADAETLLFTRPVLEAMSKEIVPLGPVGSGAQMKLINNFLAGVQVASFAEGLAWIERTGLDREAALGVLKRGAPGSPVFSVMAERMTARTYEVNFLLSLMDKDLRYAQAAAAEFGVALRTATSAEELFSKAIQQGHAGQDMSAVVEVPRDAK